MRTRVSLSLCPLIQGMLFLLFISASWFFTLCFPLAAQVSDSVLNRQELMQALQVLKEKKVHIQRTQMLIEELASNEFEVRVRAEKALVSEPDPAIEELLKAAEEHPSIEVRFRVQEIREHTRIGQHLISRKRQRASIVASLYAPISKTYEGIHPLLFEVASNFDSFELLEAAAQFVWETAEENDRVGFRKRLAGSRNAKVLAIYGLGKTGSQQDLTNLRELMGSEDVRIK